MDARFRVAARAGNESRIEDVLSLSFTDELFPYNDNYGSQCQQ